MSGPSTSILISKHFSHTKFGVKLRITIFTTDLSTWLGFLFPRKRQFPATCGAETGLYPQGINGSIDFTASIFKGQLKHSAQAEMPSLKTKAVAIKHYNSDNDSYDLFLMYQSNRSFNIPPGQTTGHLNFWKIFVQIPPSPGRKAVQMPTPQGKLPDYCFNFSVASIMLLKLCM